MTLFFFPVKAEDLYFLNLRRFNIMDTLGAPYGGKWRLLLFEKFIFSKMKKHVLKHFYLYNMKKHAFGEF